MLKLFKQALTQIKRYRRWLTVMLPLGIAGCVFIPRPATIPLAVIYDIQPESNKETLLVFLPGRGDSYQDFIKRDFFSAVREKDLAVDMVAVDAHTGYYIDRVVTERLAEDVIKPALAAGYKNIWLAGVSMGGFGAIMYSKEHPGDIAGVIAIAPYLGPDPIITEIDKAGGLRRWPGKQTGDGQAETRQDEMGWQYELWTWLKMGVEGKLQHPVIHLLYGEQDKFVRAHKLLADARVEQHVISQAGGHNWQTWTLLWRQWLNTAGRTQLN